MSYRFGYDSSLVPCQTRPGAWQGLSESSPHFCRQDLQWDSVETVIIIHNIKNESRLCHQVVTPGRAILYLQTNLLLPLPAPRLQVVQKATSPVERFPALWRHWPRESLQLKMESFSQFLVIVLLHSLQNFLHSSVHNHTAFDYGWPRWQPLNIAVLLLLSDNRPVQDCPGRHQHWQRYYSRIQKEGGILPPAKGSLCWWWCKLWHQVVLDGARFKILWFLH